MSRKRKVISKLTSNLRQEQALSLHMRTVVNTILNSLIKEFIKLIANCSKGYKELINSSFWNYGSKKVKIISVFFAEDVGIRIEFL